MSAKPVKKKKKSSNTKQPADEIDVVVGARLRAERLAQKRTLDEVSASCGFSLQMLHFIENGKVRLTVGNLVRIARALARPTRFFIDAQRNLPSLRVTKAKGEWTIEGKGVLLAGKCTQAVADAIAELGASDDEG